MPGHDEINLAEMFSQGFWDERYGAHASLWSGNPNGNLVAEISGLSPGTALDVGCGEGADAIWLARQGWTVTGADISTVALKRAAAHAAEAGPEVASRTSWEHVDIFEWDPGAGRYGLVSSQYLHPPAGRREALFRRLAAAVWPGGTLLIVGHHPSDLEAGVPRPPLPELFFTGDDVVDLLDPGDWDVVTNAARERSAVDPEGRTVTVHDTVLRAQRHS